MVGGDPRSVVVDILVRWEDFLDVFYLEEKSLQTLHCAQCPGIMDKTPNTTGFI